MTSSVETDKRTVRIGTRKSQLALVQTYWVKAELEKHFPEISFEVEEMSTKGDKILDVPLAKIGDKGLFTKELEVGMLNNTTDFAVHSLKDLPTNLPEGLMLGCVSKRVDPADALVVNKKHPKVLTVKVTVSKVQQHQTVITNTVCVFSCTK